MDVIFEEEDEKTSSDKIPFWKYGSRLSLFVTEKKGNFRKFIGGLRSFVAMPEHTTPRKTKKQKRDEIRSVLKNAEGCSEHKYKQYDHALKLYSEAISLWPTNAFYLINRAKCYMDLGNFQLAAADATNAVHIKPTFAKSYLSGISCFVVLGEIDKAEAFVVQLKENVSGIMPIQFNEIEVLNSLKKCHLKIIKSYEGERFQECLEYLEEGLNIAKLSIKYRNLKAECLVMLKRKFEANAIINMALKNNPNDAFMMFLQGLQLFIANEFFNSIKKFEEALDADPNFGRAKEFCTKAKAISGGSKYLLEGTNHYKMKNFEAALESFNEASKFVLPKDHSFSIFLYNRGSTYFQLHRFERASEDFTESLKINSSHIKSLMKRTKCNLELEEYEKFISDWELVMTLDPFRENREIFFRCIFGVAEDSTAEEIKGQYRNLLLKVHSDKHPLENRREMDEVFVRIKKAYDFLVNAV